MSSMSKLILGVDPGKDTGWALFRDAEMVECGVIEDGFEGFCQWWRHRGLENAGEYLRIVCERFVPEVGLGGQDQMWAPEIQGAIRLLAAQNGHPLNLQLRSDKSTLFGQEEQGDRGEGERRTWLAERGLEFHTNHAMDAATHVLVDRKRARDLEFWNRYFA